MSQKVRLFLFGDQTYDFASNFQELLGEQNNPILTAFLDQSCFAIRAEMNHALPPKERKASLAPSIAELLHKYRKGALSPAFQTALSCCYQLASFMAQYGEIGRPYPQPHDTYIIGMCTGALAAAAVSSCSSLSELLPAAVQTVQVAFRLGLCVVDVRDRIEGPTSEIAQSWSTVFSGLGTAEATSLIKDFCESKNLPKTSQPWIGATAGKTTTISAPPSIMRSLLDSPFFSACKSKPIPIYVPSHNSNLFSTEDVKTILETTSATNWEGYTAKLPVISSATGRQTWVGNFRGLLEKALCECLLEPLRWDAVLSQSPSLLQAKGISDVSITPFASTAASNLSSVLKSSFSVIVENPSAIDVPTGHHRGGKEKLAIIGMSGRFPEAQSPEAFWDILYQGLDVCKEVPLKRWNIDTHVDPSGKAHNKGATPWGCWLDFAGEFDPRFFSISPKEAPQMDPAQRMALMSTFEAMESAGMVPGTTPSTQLDRVGVFHGVTSNDWMETNTAQDIDTYFITGGNRGFIPGRINFCFEFCGPSYTNDTACSSSLAAIHLACNSLWRGDCDTAVAGGTNMIFTPDGHAGLDKGFFLSRTGNCKAFDDTADGYCRAEGVGTVFIKRLSDALADKDPILAVILDTKTNHSALSDSMTRPHVGAQIDNMTAVLNSACVDPRSLSYIEMHGTGTQVGDAVEMESVLSVFAPNEAFRGQESPLWVGSAKANIGHGEGVSGITSLAKVLLMMKHDTIPPHCGIKPGNKINRTYPDLGARNVHIATKPTPWIRGNQPRRVLINNFSAAGGNTALLLEDGPIPETIQEEDPRSTHIITISGHVALSLKKNMQSLLDYITANEKDGLSLPQLSWTTTARRLHKIHRVSINSSSLSEAKAGLQAAIAEGQGSTRSKSKPGILFAFTGQGSQYMGMGNTLYGSFPRFRASLHRFNQLSQNLGFESFIHVFQSNDGDIDQYPPVVVQLAICSLEMALSELLKSFGVKPTIVVGHSLGEYAALNQAGVLSVSATLFLVGKRAELLQGRCNRGTHAMLAVKASSTVLSGILIGKKYDIACINGPMDTVLSGSNDQIESVRVAISAKGLKSTLLNVPFAFHSAQVDPILESFIEISSAIKFRKPAIPILCPLDGTVITKADIFTPSYLAKHCREAVNISAALTYAFDSKFINQETLTIEVGPLPIVCGMVTKTIATSMKTLPILHRTKDVWQNLTSALGTVYATGHDVDWVEYHASFPGAHKVLDLPAYGWDLKEYYIPYEGDWCLHRHKIECLCADATGIQNHTGKMVGLLTGGKSKSAEVEKVMEVPEAKIEYPESTNVHKLIEEVMEPLGACLVFETDMSRADTQGVAAGHAVNNIALCTPSVYADIAFVLGKYLMDRLRPGYPGIIDIAELVAEKALVPHGKGPQFLRTKLIAEWAPKSAGATKHAKCEFWSADAHGKLTVKHAWCTIRFQDSTQLDALKARVPEFKSKINRLRDGSQRGEFVKYNRTAGYKLMSTVATFHPDYKLLDHLVLDESTLEACSKLNFSTVKSGGTFAAHPAYVDSITQVGGFCMNAKDSTDLDTHVFVNHGWQSFQIYEDLKNDRDYEVYVQMKHDKDDLHHGDTIVLDGETVVAFFQGVSLRCVPRKALRMVLQQTVDKASRELAKSGAAPPPAAKKVLVAAPKPSVITARQMPTPITSTNVVAALTTPSVSVSNVTIPAASIAQPKAVATTPKKNQSNPQVTNALAIIAEESGIAISDLTDESNFADIGVDSLLSMVIGSRFTEELGLELDADFSIFVDLPTVKDLKSFLGGEEEALEIEHEPILVLPQVNVLKEVPSVPVAYVAPESVAEHGPVEVAVLPVVVKQPSAQTHGAMASAAASGTAFTSLEIIAEESGIAISDLSDDSNFADIGVDSLLSMVIGSRFREELGLELDADFSIFVDLPTVADLKRFLFSGDSDNNNLSEFESNGIISLDESSESEAEEIFVEDARPKRSDHCKPTTSVILQGMPKTAAKTLFLLPDGSGSASSYVSVPKLKGDYAIVGLNCPYARDPENMNCTHTSLIDSFVTEIRRRQPSGPYYLGGWSSGGAFAFVCVEMLVARGQEVHGLVIIDAPVPTIMEQLPTSFYEHTATLGLFGNAPPPPYLIPHFRASVDVMMSYVPKPLKTQNMPKVGILWATETLMDEKDVQGMKSMHFMVHKRTEFGPDGWEKVLPGAEFVMGKVEGANHFTLMSKENIRQVSGIIEKVLA